jgi:hypothetical protein
MKQEYYIPDISEFVQGFKYEQLVKKKGDFLGRAHIGFDKGEDIYADEDIWVEKEVWWDREPQMKTSIINDEGVILKWMEDPIFDGWPTNDEIQKLINEGKIRAKYERS